MGGVHLTVVCNALCQPNQVIRALSRCVLDQQPEVQPQYACSTALHRRPRTSVVRGLLWPNMTHPWVWYPPWLTWTFGEGINAQAAGLQSLSATWRATSQPIYPLSAARLFGFPGQDNTWGPRARAAVATFKSTLTSFWPDACRTCQGRKTFQIGR